MAQIRTYRPKASGLVAEALAKAAQEGKQADTGAAPPQPTALPQGKSWQHFAVPAPEPQRGRRASSDSDPE